MIKQILVPTDGSARAMAGVRYAVSVAKQFGAKLHGLHVIDVKLLEGPFLRDVSASLGTAPYVNYQGNIAMLLDERGKAALDAFKKACQADQVDCATHLATGIVTRCIIEHSELADLIIMGRGGEHGEWLEGLLGSTTEAIVRRADRPVLVTATETVDLARLVAAYDGSHHARRALHTAAEICAQWAAPCHVVSAGKRAAECLDEAREYLAPYEIETAFAERAGDPSEAITAYAAECGAGLLIMGAYGHTKVRELVVGSTTAYALNHASCPVLLVH